MGIVGHGVDIVDLKRLEIFIDDLCRRCFTQSELQRAGNDSRRTARLAGCFAAKEAVLKAMGSGWTQGIAWTDIEVGHLASGAPTIELRGRVAQQAKALGISGWMVSISHDGDYAIGSVIAISQ